MRTQNIFTHIIILVFLALLLVSCKQAQERTSQIGHIEAGQGDVERNPQPDSQHDVVPISHVSYTDSLTSFAPAKDGVFILQNIFPASENILYLDFETKQEVFLCTSPNCKHNTTDCPSYLPLEDQEYGYNIFFFNDEIYLVQCAINASRPPHISKMGIDGSNPKDICFLDAGENFTGKVFGYGDDDILIETTHTFEGGQTEKRLERINCNSGERNVVAYYPSDSYYGLMAAVNNKLIFIKIDDTGNLYFWGDLSNDNISLADCAANAPIGTVFDDEKITYSIQGDYLCKVDIAIKEISATNLTTGQVHMFQYPSDLSDDTWFGLNYLFDDNFALIASTPNIGITKRLFDANTGNLTNHTYPISKTNNHQIITTTDNQVVSLIRSEERPMENQAEYGLSGVVCYVDVFGITPKAEFLQGDIGTEISIPY